MDNGLERLAAVIRRYAPEAGYDLDAWGGQGKLARDADMDSGTLARILTHNRMPKPKGLWPLAKALSRRDADPDSENTDKARRIYNEMVVEGDIIPAEALAHMPIPAVRSLPITAEVLADQWGVTTQQDRELVKDMLERLRLLAQQSRGNQDQGGAAAHG